MSSSATPAPAPSPEERRRYDGSRRRAAAEERRLRVLDEAATLFVAHGWTATTIAKVAAAAGVSSELVTAAFGTKAALLMSAARRTTNGPHVTLDAVIEELDLPSEPDVGKRVDAIVTLACSVLPELAPLVPVLHSAADQDPVARETLQRARQRHGDTCVLIAGLLSVGPPRPGAVDELYTMLLSETYLAFVDERGWSMEQYAAWLRRALVAAVAPV